MEEREIWGRGRKGGQEEERQAELKQEDWNY